MIRVALKRILTFYWGGVMGVPPSGSAWESFSDPGYWDMYCVRPVGERRFGCGFHLMHEDEARGLAELLTENSVSNPWSGAVV